MAKLDTNTASIAILQGLVAAGGRSLYDLVSSGDKADRKEALDFINRASFIAAAGSKKLQSSIDYVEQSDKEYQESRRNADPEQAPKRERPARRAKGSDESGEE